MKRRITGFIRQGRSWRRTEETHRERGYRLEDIRQSLKSGGLQELVCSASFPEISELKPKAKRIWFVAKKQA